MNDIIIPDVFIQGQMKCGPEPVEMEDYIKNIKQYPLVIHVTTVIPQTSGA